MNAPPTSWRLGAPFTLACRTVRRTGFLSLVALGALATGPTPRVRADPPQQQVFVFDTNYHATDLSQFSPSGAAGIHFNSSFNASWGASTNFGGFTTGLFGDEWGAGGTASINAHVGYDLSFNTHGGSVNVNLPNKISLSVPADNATPASTSSPIVLGLAQDRSALGSANAIESTFSTFDVGLGMHYGVDASVTGRIAYGVGSTSGTLKMSDLVSLFSGQPQTLITGSNPFNNNLPGLFSYDSAANKLTVLNRTVSTATGYTHTIKNVDVTSSSVPLVNTLGTVTVNPNLSQLSVASGASLSATVQTSSNAPLLGASVDILGLVTEALGLPTNPFDPSIKLPDTPIRIDLNLLSIDPNIKFGLKQTLSVLPNTQLNLKSNYDVTYRWTDSKNVVHTETSRNFFYQLPDDGSASTLQIISRPSDDITDWQLFSSVLVDPKLRNQIWLQISGGVDVTALSASLGAYGVSGGFGPLIDQNIGFGTANIALLDSLFDFDSNQFSRVYRNPRPLFGGGVLRDLNIGPDDAVQFFDQAGLFGTPQILGTLTLRNATFTNDVALTVGGSLELQGRTNAGEAPQLFITSTGKLQVDADSEFVVTKPGDPGFVTSTGAIDTGTFILGGTLSYDGPDIVKLGASAHIELLDSPYATNLGWRFSNSHGGTVHDGLRTLSLNQGYLRIAGQDLALINAFTNAGTLIVEGGHLLSAAGNFTNSGTGSITVGDGSAISLHGAFTNVSGTPLTLNGINLTLGGTTSGGVLVYDGNAPTQIGGTTSLTLSGARPTGGNIGTDTLLDGYLLSSSSSVASKVDALFGVTANFGTFRLQNGATQSVGGTASGLANPGTVEVDGSSVLTVNGNLDLQTSGTVTLTNGGKINVGGTLGNLQSSSLTGGTWNLGGVLSYSGLDITDIAPNTTVKIDGTGNGFSNNGSNAFDHFSSLGGTLSLTGGASLVTDAALYVAGNLDLASGSSLSAGSIAGLTAPLTLNNASLTLTGGLPGGSTLSFSAPLTIGGTLTYGGPLITGIGANTTVNVNNGGSLVNAGNGFRALDSVAGTLALTTGGSVRTDAAAGLTVANTGTLALGSGSTLQVTGSALTLTPGATFTTGGTLILGGAGTAPTFALPANFTFAAGGDVQLGSIAENSTYYTTTDSATLTAAGGTTWTNLGTIRGVGTISGGSFTNRGSLVAGGGTLAITGLDAPLVNSGTLASIGTPAHPARLELNDLTIQNFEGSTRGLINAQSTIAMANTTVNGGDMRVGPTGLLELTLATLALNSLTVDGSLLIHSGGTTSISGATSLRNTSTLTLETGATPATLAFTGGSTLVNEGSITLGGGTEITGVTIENRGHVRLSAGVTTNLSNISNTNQGAIDLLNGSTLNFTSANVANAGFIHLSGEDPALTPNSRSTFLLTGDLTLTGGGTIQLGGYNTSTTGIGTNGETISVPLTVWTGAGAGTLIGDFATSGLYRTLTLANQKIIGSGTFGDGTIAIDNQAGSTIGVYGPGTTLAITTSAGGFRNAGTLEVGPDTTLSFAGGPFLSYDGTTFTEGTYRIGGTLKIAGLAPTLENTLSFTFDGSNARIVDENDRAVRFTRNTASGTLAIVNGTMTFDTAIAPFTNDGLLIVGSGATMNFTGGQFTNFNPVNHTLSGGRFDLTGTLKFDGADIITNASDLTFRGPQPQILDAAGQSGLRNFSVNTGTLRLKDYTTFTVSNSVAIFGNSGSIIVDAGSTFDFNAAGVANSAPDAPDYFLQGTLKAAAPFATAGTTLTLYGTGAHLLVGSATQPTFLDATGRLTFAGGYHADYTAGATITSNGLWEFGSATAAGPNGTTLRSGGYATLGSIDPLAPASVTMTGSGRVRVYGGATDDDTTVTGDAFATYRRAVVINDFTMNGGTFDADGTVLISHGGTFTLNGVLEATRGDLTFKSGDQNERGGTLTLTGGLIADSAIDTSNLTAFNFTPVAGMPLSFSGNRDYTFSNLNFGDTNRSLLTLKNGARLRTTGGANALDTLWFNDATITADNAVLELNRATGFANNAGATMTAKNGGDIRVAVTLSNAGTLDNQSQIHVGTSFSNSGVVTGGGVIFVGGDFNNRSGGQFSGVAKVDGNLTNAVGGTFIESNGTSAIAGNLENRGVMDFSGTVSGSVDNFGTLTAGDIQRPDHSYATIVNAGTLLLTGDVHNGISDRGDVHTTGGTEFLGNMTAFEGTIHVDSGSLQVSADSQLGKAPDVLQAGAQVIVAANASLSLSAALGATRTIHAEDGATISGTGAAAVNGRLVGLGDLTLSGKLAANLQLASTSTLKLSAADVTLNQGIIFAQTVTSLDPLSGGSHLRLPGAQTLEFKAGADFFGDVHITNAQGQLLVGGSVFTPGVDSVGLTAFNGGTALTYGAGNVKITGTGAVEVRNNTALTFTSDNTYSGGTTIAAGSSLTLGNGGSTGNVDGPIANAGTLAINRDDIVVLDQVTGTGAIRQAGTGATVLNTLGSAGAFEVAAGYLVFGQGGALNGTLSAPIANDSHLIFNFDAPGSVIASGVISGAGDLVHAGSGTLTLTGANTYSGKTTVARDFTLGAGGTAGGGSLRINGDSALGAAPATFVADQLTLDGATLVATAATTLAATRGVTIGDLGATFAGNLTLQAPLSGNGAVTYAGGGTLQLTLPSSSTRDFTVDAGTLVFNTSSSTTSFTGTLSGAADTTTRFSGAGRTYLSGSSYAGEIVIDPTMILNLSGALAGALTLDGTLEVSGGNDFTLALPNGSGRVENLNPAHLTLAAPHAGSFRGTLALNSQLGVTETASLSAVFAGPSTFVADALTFNGGTLRVTSSDSTSATMGVRVNTSGTIDLPNATTLRFNAPLSGTGTLNLTGAGSIALGNIGTATNQFDLRGGDLLANNSSDITLSGAIHGTGGLTVSAGTAKVILTTFSDYTGGTHVLNGTLQLGNGGAGSSAGSVAGAISVGQFGNVAYKRSDDFTLPNTITGAGGLIQAGAGTLTIDSAQTYTGTTRVSAGTLRLTDGASFAGALVTDATLAFDYATDHTFAESVSGTGGIRKSGTATATLTAANSYAGATDVDAGKLVLTGANTGTGGGSIASGATLEIAGANGAAGGTFANAGTLALSRSGYYSLALATTGTGTIVKTGAGNAYLTRTADSANNLSILAGNFGYDIAGTAVLSGQITGAGQLLKAGTGTLVLTQNSDFAAGANVTAGTLQLGDNTTTGFIAGPVTVASGATLAYKRSNAIALADAFSGAGAFAQLGSGTVTITGNFTHTGGTRIGSGATLQIGSNGTTGSLAGNVANDGLLLFNRSDAYAFTGDTTGSGTLQQSGSGTLTLTGQHTATGGAIIDSGRTLALGTSATLTGPIANSGNLTILTDPNAALDRELPVSVSGSGGVTIDGGGTLRIAGDLTYAGTTTIANASTLKLVTTTTSTLGNVITGSGNFVKLGAGTLILTADSDLSGTVTVGDGTLQLGDNGTTGSIGGSVATSSIALQGGTLAIKHSDAITMANVISGGGGLAQLGSGRLTLTNDNTFTGTVRVGSGSELQLGTGGTTGSVVGHLDVDGLLQSTRLGDWAINLGLTGSGTITKPFVSASDVITIAGDPDHPVAFTGTVSYAGGTVVAASTGTLGTVTADHLRVTSGSNLTLAGANGALDTLNNGTLTIGNGGTSGTFSGAITGGGTLAFNRSDAFTFDGSIASGALHQLGTGTTTFNNRSQVFSGGVQIDAGNLVLATLVGGAIVNNGTLTLAYGRLDDGSTLSGSGKVVTASSGTTTLPSNASYTGETEIAGGVLELSPNGGTTTLGGLVTGPGGLRVATAGTVALGSGGTYTGATELVSAPTLKVGGSLASAVSGNGTLEFNNTNAATASGNLSGAIALDKTGAGMLTLTGTNTHSGDTRIEAGTLRLGSAAALSGDSSLFLANSAAARLELANFDAHLLMLTGGGSAGGDIDLGSGRLTVSPHTALGTPLDGTYAGAITGTGGLTMDGHGTLTLTGSNSYTGGTSILQGTLAAAGDGALGLGTVLLDGGTLRLAGDTTFGASRPIQTGSAGGTLAVSNGITATIDSAITGSGTFFKDGAGTALLNATPTNSGLVQINAGTLALGTGTLTSSQLLINGGTLDLSGHSWSTTLDIRAGGIANSSGASVLVSGQLDTQGTLALQSTGGDLRVTGAITSTNGAVHLTADGTGRVSLGDTPAGSLGRIDVTGGTLALENAAALTALDGLVISNRGQVELAGGSTTLALGYLTFNGGALAGDIGGLQNTAAGTTMRVESPLTTFAGNALAGAAIQLGGAGNLTLAGHAEGGVDLAKVGTGRLTLEGDYAAWTGGFDVRAGTLVADSALLQGRALNLQSGGSLDFGAASSLSLGALTGNGTLALGSADLTLNVDATFSGEITGSGTVTKAGPGATSLGSLSVGALMATNGNTSVTGSISPGTLLQVEAGASLRVNAASVTSNGGATFTGNVNTNSLFTLLNQTTDLTTNAGTITLRGGGSLNDDAFVHHTLDTITRNTGTLRAEGGASLSLGSGFVNTGTVSIGANSGLSAGVGNTTAITQAGGSLSIESNASVTVRTLNVTGGTLALDGTLLNFSGSPTLALTGGTLTGNGQINGRLTLSGGTFSPGHSPGEMTVSNSTWNGGGEFRFEFNALPGAGVAGANWDLLTVSNALTLNATASNRFTLDLVSLTSTNAAGLLAGFDPTQNYTWSFVSAASITGFDPASFTILTSGFANSFQGAFSVAFDANHLNLIYSASGSGGTGGSPIPEPSTYAAILGIISFGLVLWRRRATADRAGQSIPRPTSP